MYRPGKKDWIAVDLHYFTTRVADPVPHERDTCGVVRYQFRYVGV